MEKKLIKEISNLMDQKLQILEEKMDARFKETEEKMDARFKETEEKMDARFKETEERMDKRFKESEERINKRFDAIEGRLDKHDEKFDSIEEFMKDNFNELFKNQSVILDNQQSMKKDMLFMKLKLEEHDKQLVNMV